MNGVALSMFRKPLTLTRTSDTEAAHNEDGLRRAELSNSSVDNPHSVADGAAVYSNTTIEHTYSTIPPVDTSSNRIDSFLFVRDTKRLRALELEELCIVKLFGTKISHRSAIVSGLIQMNIHSNEFI